MNKVKSFEDFINEGLRPKNPNEVITIDVDLAGDDADIMSAIKKFKLTAKPNGANNGYGYDLTGKRKDLISYLTSEYYEADEEDIEDIWPELLEGSQNDNGIFIMDNQGRHLHIAPEDVKDFHRGRKIFATDEDGEEYEVEKKNVDIVSESDVNEAMVQIAGKNKPAGAQVLAKVIFEKLNSSGVLKPGMNASMEKAVEDAIATIIMENTF